MKLNSPFALALCILVAILAAHEGEAQKLLLVERAGNPRTERIQLFDEINFTLKDNDKLWYKRQVLDMDVNGQLILLGDTWIPISDIGRIRLKRQRAWPNIIGGALAGGGASMILGDLWYTVVRDAHQLTEGGMEFGLLNIAVGAGMRAAFAPIKYRLGERRRLRAVDLTF